MKFCKWKRLNKNKSQKRMIIIKMMTKTVNKKVKIFRSQNNKNFQKEKIEQIHTN